MSEGTIKIGLVGYGFAGSTIHVPLINSVDGLSIRAIYSSKERINTDSISEVYHYQETARIFNDPEIDVVVITSPNQFHFKLCQQALLAGKHVVVEKPFTVTSEEANILATLARSRRLVLAVFQNRRWDSGFLTAKLCISKGLLGEIYSYESNFSRHKPQANLSKWKEQQIPGSGILYDVGSHLVDQCLTLFGLPTRVYCDLMCQRKNALVDDGFLLVLDYSSNASKGACRPGLRAVLRATHLGHETDSFIKVSGSDGMFVKNFLDSQEDSLRLGEDPNSPNWGYDKPDHYGTIVRYGNDNTSTNRESVASSPGRYQEFYQMIRSLVRRIQNGEDLDPLWPSNAVSTIRIIELAVSSSQLNTTMELR